MVNKIEFICDKIDLGKKRSDGSRQVLIDVGEYQHQNLLPILILKEGNFKITIEDYARKKNTP